jgi:2-polyprenyl-6-methoxyphenol hydroxylase-like FAD-dependent oxidoreductase
MTTESPSCPEPAGDLLVVGGGPAGLAAAIAARLERLTVTLVDRRRPPIDKACGEGIMPDGVALLGRLGVRLPADGVFPFRGILYQEGPVTTTARFQDGPGLGVRRTTLHAALVRRAEDLGVRLLWGRRVRALTNDGALLDSGLLRSRFTVAADGVASRIRHGLGLDGRVRSRRIGLRRHYRVAPWSDQVEVWYADGCDAYVTPIAPDCICLAVLTTETDAGLDALLARFPALAARLAGAEVASDDLGSATVYARARRFRRGRVFLLGDAAVSVDAITGEGVTLALHQAVALARALAAGRPGDYSRACGRLARLPMAMTALMLTLHHRPRLRRATLQLLSRFPLVFSGLLALHTRAVVPNRLMAGLLGLAASRSPHVDHPPVPAR